MATGSLQAIRYQRGKLEVLDQLRLPHEFVYDNVTTCEEAFDCIKSMRVRGVFPAISTCQDKSGTRLTERKVHLRSRSLPRWLWL